MTDEQEKVQELLANLIRVAGIKFGMDVDEALRLKHELLKISLGIECTQKQYKKPLNICGIRIGRYTVSNLQSVAVAGIQCQTANIRYGVDVVPANAQEIFTIEGAYEF